MNKNFKKYNIFLFIATFARAMVESFVPIVLYKNGFSFREIILYQVIMLAFTVLVVPLLTCITNVIKHKYLLILTVITFAAMNILLINPIHSLQYLVVLGFYYAVYRKSFWMIRRYYNITCTTKTSSGKLSGLIVVNVYLAGVLASLAGGYLIDANFQKYQTIIASTLLLISALPLITLKGDTQTKVEAEDVIAIFKEMPNTNLLYYITYEAYYFINLLFPLYMFIYITNNCKFVGIFNLLLNASSVAFILLFAKKIDKDKKDHLRSITIILAILYLIKASVDNGTLMLIIGVFEGYFLKFHNVSHIRNTAFDAKKYNKAAYNVVLEMIMNTTRFVLAVIYYVLNLSFKPLLIISAILFSLMAVFKFDDGKGGYN